MRTKKFASKKFFLIIFLQNCSIIFVVENFCGKECEDKNVMLLLL